MPKMPRLGGSHTFEELEAIAHKADADAKAAEAKVAAPDDSADPALPADPAPAA